MALGVVVGVTVDVAVGVALGGAVGVGEHGGPLAPADIDSVHAPALTGAAVVTRHPPAQLALYDNWWQSHCRSDKATRIAAPCATTSNRTAPVGANCTVIAAHKEASAGIQDVMNSSPLINTDLQHAAVKAEARILA